MPASDDPLSSFSPSPTPSPELPKPGERIASKYTITRLLAEGGMGVVFEAHHDELDERVAIKVLRPEVALESSEDVVGRFKREARAGAKIRNEHVVRVYDVDVTASGLPYLVMEFLVGRDLEQILRADAPLDVKRVVDWVLEACEALAEAHAIGIVHRDLKPANLFLHSPPDGAECVKIVDFGISKMLPKEGSLSLTRTQSVFGSPFYMSPEQMRSSKDVDARSDVWALGTILHELLVGVVPFPGETMTEVCAGILQDDPPSLLRRRPDIPAGVDAVVQRCLQKRPADRFQDVGGLATALAPFGGEGARISLARITRATSRGRGTLTSLTAPVGESVPSASSQSLRASSPSGALTTTAWDRAKESGSAVGVTGRTKLGVSVAAMVLLGIGAAVGFSRYVGQKGSVVAEPSAAISAAPVTASGSLTPLEDAGIVVSPEDAVVAIPSATVGAPGTKRRPPAVARPATGAPPRPGSNPASTPQIPPTPKPSGDLWDGRK